MTVGGRWPCVRPDVRWGDRQTTRLPAWFKVAAASALISGTGCGEASPPRAADTTNAVPGNPEASNPPDPAERHAERVRALYSRAGLAAPAEADTRLPICEASVSAVAEGWSLGVRCEGPAATTVPAQGRRPGCSAVLGKETTVPPQRAAVEGGGLTVIEVAVTLAHVPTGDGAECPGLLVSRPEALFLTNLAGPVGGLPALAHWQLEVAPPRSLRAATFGIELPAPRPRSAAFRPASAGLGVRLEGGLVTTEHPAGDDSLIVAADGPGEGTAAALGRRLAGALDDLRAWVGPAGSARGPSALHVTAELDPGEVVHGEGGAFVGADPADALPAPDLGTVLGHIREAEPGALVAILLVHHPLRQDTVFFHASAALIGDLLRGPNATTPFGEAFTRAAANVIALRLIGTREGDKAARRARELAVRWPLSRLLDAGEPDLSRLEVAGDAATLKATRLLDALSARLGDDAGQNLLLATARGEATTPDAFQALVRRLAPVREDAEAVLDTWLWRPDALASEGPPSLATLLEYVADGGAALVGRLALDGLASNPELLGAAAGLANGETGALVPVLDALEGPISEAVGADGAGAVGTLFDVGRLVLGGDAASGATATRLVDELGTELGLEEADRGRLRMLADEVVRAMRAGRPGPSPLQGDLDAPPAVEPAPDAPARPR